MDATAVISQVVEHGAGGVIVIKSKQPGILESEIITLTGPPEIGKPLRVSLTQ